MAAQALWPFALGFYTRPGAEAALLELQDAHGQCVAYLIWALWLGAERRPADARVLAQGAELARSWQTAALVPLRTLRRELAAAGPLADARGRLRAKVQALELEAERMLLQMLEAASPPASKPAEDATVILDRAATAWSRDRPPTALLQALAAL